MPTLGFMMPGRTHSGQETEVERVKRLDRERVLIEEARAELRQGLALDPDEFKDWLEKLGTPYETPIPEPASRAIAPRR